jgi:hypothetical protein
MAIRRLTYLEIPLAKRKAAANRVREQVRAALMNPFLATEQKAALVYQIDRITQWETGVLPLGAAFALPGMTPS